MAITITTSVTPSTVQQNTPVTVMYAVTNNGASSVNVVNIIPTAQKTGDTAHQTFPGNWGSAPVGTGLAVAVGAGLTVNFPVGFVPFIGTTGPIGGGSGTVTIGGLVSTNDGQSVSASTSTLTVTSIQSTYIAAEQTSAQPVAYP